MSNPNRLAMPDLNLFKWTKTPKPEFLSSLETSDFYRHPVTPSLVLWKENEVYHFLYTTPSHLKAATLSVTSEDFFTGVEDFCRLLIEASILRPVSLPSPSFPHVGILKDATPVVILKIEDGVYTTTHGTSFEDSFTAFYTLP